LILAWRGLQLSFFRFCKDFNSKLGDLDYSQLLYKFSECIGLKKNFGSQIEVEAFSDQYEQF